MNVNPVFCSQRGHLVGDGFDRFSLDSCYFGDIDLLYHQLGQPKSPLGRFIVGASLYSLEGK